MNRDNANKSHYHSGTARIILCLLLGLFAAFLLLFPARIPFFKQQLNNLELASRDLRMSLRPERKLDERIIIIGLTDIEHYLYGKEINSREAYIYLLQSLRQMGVKAVIFDILFEHTRPVDPALAFKMQETPSYISYKFLRKNMPLEEPADMSDLDSLSTQTLESRILESMDMMNRLNWERSEAFANLNDQLVEEIDRKLSEEKNLMRETAKRWFRKRWGLEDKSGPRAIPPEAGTVVLPSASLMLNAKGLGFINLMKTGEDVVRRIPLFIRYGDRLYPHIDLVFLCDYYGVKPADLNIEFGRYVSFQPQKNRSEEVRIPIDRSGRVTMNFRSDDLSHNSYHLQKIWHYTKFGDEFPTDIDPEEFKDAIVIVGELNPGGSDVEPIPLAPAFPMVGVHANLINMVWHDDYISEPGPALEPILTLLFGLIMGAIFAFLEYRRASVASVIVMLIFVFANF